MKLLIILCLFMKTITVNNQNLHYVTLGPKSGEPFLLLHGNGGSHKSMRRQLIQLALRGYRVYALDSRGQGANEPLTEYHYADMAQDTYLFCQALGINKPYVYGWSDGGNIALMAEIAHPGLFKAIITSGANITPDGVTEFAEKEAELREEFKSNPLFLMMLDEPHISVEELSTIACPCLIMAGDADAIAPEHTRKIAASIPKGELCIVPNADHGSYIKHSSRAARIFLRWLKNISFARKIEKK